MTSGKVSEEQTRVSVEIMGEKYILKSREDSDRLQKLARQVDAEMHRVQERSPKLSHLKVAIVSALNIAGELVTLQEKYDALVNLIEDEKKVPRNRELPVRGVGS